MLDNLVFVTGLVIVSFLLTKQTSFTVWTIIYIFFILFGVKYALLGFTGKFILWASFSLLIFCTIKPLRRTFITRFLFRLAQKKIPSLSITEQQALAAGNVSFEVDLFSASPDFTKLLKLTPIKLNSEEQAFLDGPVNELCRMIDDWEITHVHTDMPPEMWQFIKDKGFLGMIIPKKYGGLEFSATAQVAVLTKIYGRSVTVATSISVPNSLGPAELILNYGTAEQRNHYLPRLADGREIPCFALTGPQAGSDATSIPDIGIVCKQQLNGRGEEVLGIRLNWNKRYITLCPIATVIGLAFRLFDPENLLGRGKDIGITCALIPANTPGVIRGRRHFPLNTAFLNGPTQGNNVFIPIDYLIGGQAQAGNGWRMLMECLSVGRAIALPSSAVGGARVAALASGAYARVRKQFGQAIANFEGIEEPLAKIAGNAYLMDAGLTMTATAVDHGAKSAIAGAIVKYHTTEGSRQILINAMDIHGGKGICLGPKNYLGRGYQSAPISITVEGANILTRSLIIFGQGIIRCHPYVFKEWESIEHNNIKVFDEVFWQHILFVLANITKCVIFSFTDGRFISVPKSKVKRYFQLIHRYSASLALLADFSLLVLGGQLKRKEKISARLGDILSNLYLASAVLKKFHDDGETINDLPLVHWCCQQLLYECETAIHTTIVNFPAFWARILLKIILQPFGRYRIQPKDSLGKELAKILTSPNPARERFNHFVFAEPLANCPFGRLEQGFHKICAIENLEKKLARAVKDGVLTSLTLGQQIDEAKTKGIIDNESHTLLTEAENIRNEIITVDDFADEDLRRTVSTNSVNQLNGIKNSSEKKLTSEAV